jgi:hypothetical protein
MIAFPRQPRIPRVRFSGPVTGCMITTALLLLSGCRAEPKPHTPPPGVPDTARLITERSGGLGFSAPEIGTVYIYDETVRRVIYKSAVNYRDNLIFYPAKDRIILNGNVVKEDPNLNEDHVHRLYFVKG